ncbi:MAG TPA: hypothetical protein VGD65_20195 [Chryseosolibacter sp.]
MKSTTIDFPKVTLKFNVNSDAYLMQSIETDNGIVFNPQDAGKIFDNVIMLPSTKALMFKITGSLDSLKKTYEWN